MSTTAVMNVADDAHQTVAGDPADVPEAHGLENDDGADSR